MMGRVLDFWSIYSPETLLFIINHYLSNTSHFSIYLTEISFHFSPLIFSTLLQIPHFPFPSIFLSLFFFYYFFILSFPQL